MSAGKGESNSQAKLTVEQVRAIRRDTRPLKVMALKYGISEAHVWRIRNRIRWKELPDEDEQS